MQSRSEKETLHGHGQDHQRRHSHHQAVHDGIGVPPYGHDGHVYQRHHRDRDSEQRGMHGKDKANEQSQHSEASHETSPHLLSHPDSKVAVGHKEVLKLLADVARCGAHRELLRGIREVRHVHDGWKFHFRHVLSQELAEGLPALADVVDQKLRLPLRSPSLSQAGHHVGVVPPVAAPCRDLVEVRTLERMGSKGGIPCEAKHLAELVVGWHQESLQVPHHRAVPQRRSRQILVHHSLRPMNGLPPFIFISYRQNHSRVRIEIQNALPEAERGHAHDDRRVSKELGEGFLG
mmetsp:Transcript_9160/g.20204  ORF Transcript_9160/g.20204 Transcript_9160/m.20204 type:complete len:291 (-) Transcript_9160:514-1386(-)